MMNKPMENRLEQGLELERIRDKIQLLAFTASGFAVVIAWLLFDALGLGGALKGPAEFAGALGPALYVAAPVGFVVCIDAIQKLRKGSKSCLSAVGGTVVIPSLNDING